MRSAVERVDRIVVILTFRMFRSGCWKTISKQIHDALGKGNEFFIVAHSYGTSQVVTMLSEAGTNIAVYGVVMVVGTVGGRSSQVAIDGGHPIFGLPIFVLNLIQSKLTNEFLSTPYFGTNMFDYFEEELSF